MPAWTNRVRSLRSSLAPSMPRLIEPVAPIDGRQSEMALFVARGTRRLLRAKGFCSVTELTLQSGRRADVVALSNDGTIHIVEIKSSIADFRADQKWRDYRLHCDRLYFAIPADMPQDIMPEDAGLIVADAYGAAVVREAPEHRLNAATRRAVLMRFAQTAAQRLHGLSDPQIAAMQPLE
jgi:hypothetical protein